jgi:asparagine synthase (glutamine-hydrolysing)
MAGIAGIIRKEWNADATSTLARMLACMARERFEVSGTWIHEAAGVGLAWVCQRGSFSDCLPIWNEARNICLVFCGESFADRGTIQSLAAKGHQFDPDDAGYLVHLYEERGFEFLEQLNGWFSGVLVDLRESQTVLFNDRYGLKRIYYHQDADGFYFASEAKSLLKVAPQTRRLDPQGLGEFLSCGCVLQNRTLFSGIAILPGGVRWTFRPDASCRKESYFTPDLWENQPALSAAEYCSQLADTFRRVLPFYLGGNQPVGLSLTGGIDSRLILAWAKRNGESLPCYTFGGPYRDCADVHLARRLAKVCGLPHQTIAVGEEFVREFPALAEKTVYLSDGAMDVSGAAELYVNQRAREIAPVRLTGNYGSEILRSNVAFKPARLDAAVFGGELGDALRNAEATYAAESRCHRLSFIAFKQVPWHHFARSAIEQSQLTMRSPYLDNALVKLAYQAPAEMSASSAHLLRLISAGNPLLARFGTDRAIRLRPIPIVSQLLHLYQELTARAEYAYEYGMPQWLATMDKWLAAARLERLFLGRHKFYHFRVWYRDALAKFVRAVLLDSRALRRPYLNGRRLEAMIATHTAGTGNYTLEIHKLLSVELLQRLLIEQN